MNSKFKIQCSRFLVLRRCAPCGAYRRTADRGWRTFFWTLLLTSMILAGNGGLPTADIFADVYAPADSIVLTVGCLDTTFLNVANPDSAWFKWWRDVGGQTMVDSAKVTTGLRTGFFRKKIKASDASNNFGTYIAEAVVYKGGKTGIKTWTWMVKAEFDSITAAITDVNKANFKATVVKINGGYAGQCTSVVNEVKVNSSDTLAYVTNLGPTYMTKGDSFLYMRTDWANIKNPTTYQNFSQTRFHIADSLGEEISVSVDSPSIARSVWNESIVPRQNKRIRLADSLDEEITAVTDTVPIARYTWNYVTRTLTSGAGSGANSIVIRCKQSSDSTNIAAVQIQVLDSVENSTIGLSTSDSQGRGFFALDNGIYCVRMYKPGWQFTVPETLKVDGNENATYYADAFDPGLPPEANLCRVYGWIYDINNQPVAGAKIEASIKTIPLRYENVIISPYYKNTTTDDEGYWHLDLYPNSALNPSDTKYMFFIYASSGTILKIETAVPDQANWELQW
jgi:hypothetical protein